MGRYDRHIAVVIIRWYGHLSAGNRWHATRATYPAGDPNNLYRLVYVESLFSRDPSLEKRLTEADDFIRDLYMRGVIRG